jgi:VWFA-related protein
MVYLLALLLLQSSIEPIIRVPSRLVMAPATVLTKDGRFIHGLELKHFRVYDNGRLQKAQLDSESQMVSIVIAVQTNAAVREYVPEINRVASVVETLLMGEEGEAAVLSFNNEVRVVQPFTSASEPLDKAIRALSPAFEKSRAIDAILRGIELLKARPVQRRRVLLLVTQSSDAGSSGTLREALLEAELHEIRVYALLIPRVGKALVHDTLSIVNPDSLSHHGRPGGLGGIAGNLELSKLVPEIYRGRKTASGQDAITVLTSYTGGRKVPFRNLRELESALTAVGEELHSGYILSYRPDRDDPGYHRIRVEVARREVVVHTRPGYYMDTR